LEQVPTTTASPFERWPAVQPATASEESCRQRRHDFSSLTDPIPDKVVILVFVTKALFVAGQKSGLSARGT